MECPKCKNRLQVKEHTEAEVHYACLNDKCELYGVITKTEGK